MARVSFNKIINTNKFKYLIAALIIILIFGTCYKCTKLITVREGASAKSTDADGDTKDDTSGNKKKKKKHFYENGSCKQMTDADAKKICKSKNCDGDASITKACNKIDCYKCITNSDCHANC